DGIDVAAASGATVTVGAGTYAENVTINKGLNLLGPNAGIAYSGTRGAEAFVHPASGTAINITVAGSSTVHPLVKIDGLKIQGDAGVNLNNGDNFDTIQILNNTISGADSS